MPRDGAGNYILPLADVVVGTTILAAWANPTMADVKAALTASIAKDGQTNPSANLPMNTFKHTGVAAATANGQYYRYDEVNSVVLPAMRSSDYVATVGGTANAITLTPAPAISAYAAGQRFSFIPTAFNYSKTVNLNISGLGNKLVQRNNEAILRIGDIPGTLTIMEVEYDGTVFRLLNPANGANLPKYMFAGYLTADQSIPDNTLTVLSGFTEEIDGNSLFGVSKYVIPETGWYRVHFSASLQSNAGNPTEQFLSLLTDNAAVTTYLRGSDTGGSVGISPILTSHGSGLLHFTALDEVSLTVGHVTGVARSVVLGTQYTRLSVEYVGP